MTRALNSTINKGVPVKKTILVVVLAIALTFAFAASAYATSAKTFNSLSDYYSWGTVGTSAPYTPLADLGANPDNPGVHANYLATTAKCGICHSVHRATADGVKLLNATVATCAGCHAAGTGTITTKLISWEVGGPHHSGTDADCGTRACHASSPHGVGVSTYTLLATKLINVGADTNLASALATGTDAARGFSYDDVMASAASTLTAGEKDALISGYTCNQPACHAQTTLAVLEKGWSEARESMYPFDGNLVNKTGHLSSAVATEGAGSYAPVNSCISCHDQTDDGTTSGYTFPHSQTAYGADNLVYPVLGTGRAYLWMGYAGSTIDTLTAVESSDMKAYDGTCLKCHRNGTSGIGIDH